MENTRVPQTNGIFGVHFGCEAPWTNRGPWTLSTLSNHLLRPWWHYRYVLHMTRYLRTDMWRCLMQERMPIIYLVRIHLLINFVLQLWRVGLCQIFVVVSSSVTVISRSEMSLRGKSVRSWCDGSSDRSFMVWTH